MTSRMRPLIAAFLALSLPMACTMGAGATTDAPAARWDHRPEGDQWTHATLSAISTKGRALIDTDPADIESFCPAYPEASEADRKAFWMGLFSALAKHESTWNPKAAGEGGKYRGLLQIAPATARAYGCDATALYDGQSNLSCAVNIASRQVERTGVVAGGPGGWGGLAADWGPMRNGKKRAEIAAWTRSQDYCRI
ncbi:Transglycosylase SLT domain-containing protein [Gemmobacter megaterium]|uniref:Transglycosylase SLT domain-containing protein n=1 Tax=Gemmobacter megaterium TaxID=1086013 RepID=A0A1N7QN06_9RHOB|nr:transglycosylase SLT domain-containing protein [Gemmobacter megaterium]SIT24169.1 Transglycosylase SLT domain-containing protein [Gemmobacter megaterium]